MAFLRTDQPRLVNDVFILATGPFVVAILEAALMFFLADERMARGKQNEINRNKLLKVKT